MAEINTNGLEIVKGAQGKWQLTLRDRLSKAITTYLGTETLTADCWPGDDEAAAFHPTATWINAALGTIQLAVSAAQSATLTPGMYDLLLWITAGAADPVSRPIAGGLRVLRSPASATAPLTFCARSDMEDIYPRLDRLDSLPGHATNFLRERAQATTWVIAQCLARASRDFADQARRHLPILASAPIYATTGVDAGLGWGPSTIPDATIRDGLISLKAAIDGGALLVNLSLDNGQTKQLTATYALYLVFRRQAGETAKTPDQALAAEWRSEAIHLLAGYVPWIDTDGDGVPDRALVS
jgi:hypothetical protein